MRLDVTLCALWRSSVVVLCLLAATASDNPTAALAQEPRLDYSIANGHFFRQGHGERQTDELGYALVDDTEASLWSEFQRLGGISSLGYPISQRLGLSDGRLHQLTERALLRWLPEERRAERAPVFSMLSSMGRDEWLASLGVPRPALRLGSNEERLAWLTDDAIRAEYLRAPPSPSGGSSSVYAQARFGLPVGPPEAMGPFVAQRFERAVLQRWLRPDGGALGAEVVTEVPAGTLFAWSGLVPEPALAPHAPDHPVVVHVHPASAPLPRRLFAISTHWWFLLAHQEPYLDRLRALKVDAVRMVISWEQFHFAGGFDFSSLDRAVGAMDWAGIETMGQFVGVPTHLAENPAECFALALSCRLARSRAPEMVRAVRALVARYPQIRRWEFWNEPENWEAAKNPADYRFWFEQFYRAVKGVQPEAVVAVSSFGGWQFLSQVLPGLQFDAAALHPYQYFGVDKAAILELRNGLAAMGRGDAQLWVTEYGWSTVDRRAEAVAQEFLQAHQWLSEQPYVTVAALHMLHDWHAERKECCFGLVGPPPDFAPKIPYFEAFRTLATRNPSF